ncbi:hypothetical protein I7G59_09750 [Sinorhizobium meliloti]|uniref:hypothetical protein n=1 Tax=Rhizobium meliloti TaxID=382 RepID=UPI002380222D|nr:hypothetical protein [Sinorhizobium meliloti]MDE3797610.1 hypothetical protein [Sinorhizobium meliloti]
MSVRNVRAKFFVSEVRHVGTPATDPFAVVTLLPVFSTYGDGKANESWSKHTPSGKIEMNITNPDAIDAFDVGKAYFVDFTPVEWA